MMARACKLVGPPRHRGSSLHDGQPAVARCGRFRSAPAQAEQAARRQADERVKALTAERDELRAALDTALAGRAGEDVQAEAAAAQLAEQQAAVGGPPCSIHDKPSRGPHVGGDVCSGGVLNVLAAAVAAHSHPLL